MSQLEIEGIERRAALGANQMMQIGEAYGLSEAVEILDGLKEKYGKNLTGLSIAADFMKAAAAERRAKMNLMFVQQAAKNQMDTERAIFFNITEEGGFIDYYTEDEK